MELTSLIVVNRTQNVPFQWSQNAPPSASYSLWKTCLRNILITTGKQSLEGLEILPTDDVYDGMRGYNFLLEVICGLHSQVFGETEVLGQFRERFIDSPAWLNPAIESLLVDSKLIRQKVLQNLGSQSYGSFLRKTLPPNEPVVVVGSGNLTQSILPYLLNSERVVQILSRDVKKTEQSLSQFEGAQISDLTSAPTRLGFHFVIAAPIDASDILKWTKKGCKTIVDFRETCLSDPITHPRLTTLVDFFRTQREILERNQSLKETIKEFVATHLLTPQHRLARPIFRPFGWEDLCG